MEENKKENESGSPEKQDIKLEGGTYEIIRKRLDSQGEELLKKINQLDTQRKSVFGSVEQTLLASQRISTINNCEPRDMIVVGDHILFGYNVRIGLRSETKLSDVFASYGYQDQNFKTQPLSLLSDKRFETDFCDLYRYYKNTRFAKFFEIGPFLYMVFHFSENPQDIKSFKWSINDDGTLTYIDNRSDHEVKFPPQHEFEWTRVVRDMQRMGKHPHISINDIIFVETIGGDLTIKIEDNTETGSGIYSEKVDNPDQTLDDGEIWFADLGSAVVLKIKPYQEKSFRYLVYSKKIQKVYRIDRIEDSCVLLPEEHGLIFPNGYFLRTGDYKEFDNDLVDMCFEKRISSPNGEDFLYIFYNKESGTYVLLSYNLISQSIENPIICHGYCLLNTGELIYFLADKEPRKSHVIQIWQTAYMEDGISETADKEAYLYKIGNSDIVRCIAGCRSILGLLNRKEIYNSLYSDIVKFTTEIIDGYFWLNKEEAFLLTDSLKSIRDTANSAIDEFEKVIQLKLHARQSLSNVDKQVKEAISSSKSGSFKTIDPFVQGLEGLRTVRGEIISLREIRYIDQDAINNLEQTVIDEIDRFAGKCVLFLLQPDSLTPYAKRIETLGGQIGSLAKFSDAQKVDKEVNESSSNLEMLLDVVGNLKIEDTTQRTKITDDISNIFSTLNRVRTALKNKKKELASVEGKAEFGSQIKLLNQAVINYLDVCDTAEKCEEYLGKVMIQVEELEGKFSDYEDFTSELSEKREEIYNTFETRRLQLTEKRNRKTDSLLRSANRILKGVRTRSDRYSTVEEIHSYFAGDLMIDKIRGIISQLTELKDTVKAGDIQAKLKTIKEDSVRQLKDRKDLFSGEGNVIQFGRHKFAVNTQELDLTIVQRDGEMYLHLTGTNFFEQISDEEFLATEKAWKQEIVSESEEIYRGEYLAFLLFNELSKDNPDFNGQDFNTFSEEEKITFIQKFMGPRYSEGYIKGVHDIDSSIILSALLEMKASIGLLRYNTDSRALAIAFWNQFDLEPKRSRLETKLRSFGQIKRFFGGESRQKVYMEEIETLISGYISTCPLFKEENLKGAAAYLFNLLCDDSSHPVSVEAGKICKAFYKKLELRSQIKEALDKAVEEVSDDSATHLILLHDWISAFTESETKSYNTEYIKEATSLIFSETYSSKNIMKVSINQTLKDLVGSHGQIEKGQYQLNYNKFFGRLELFQREDVPCFENYLSCKKELLENGREAMRLDEFKPRILTSFVRNQLIDRVYLPLIGDNLAKQIGVVGDQTRTDRMGMLLLISPPGYGKTTLMEYISKRLGLVFMKINGPALGHQVTSLDPVEAPNAAAREELNKLNLSLEMGDNVMIYLDDIQHCNPEFLQKFISLCDGQRKIEGVYKGKPQTYDLRGKTVAVVMAGNPYTESGDKFRIPDMLANRADTYNLGDIIGDSNDVFELSYIENALTSSPILNPLASKSQKDIYNLIHIADTDSREGVDFEGNFSTEELNDYVSVLKKLFKVRDVVLSMNMEYIRSAAQAEEFRTEPSFKLQGSYRNMCRMVEKIQPIMNDKEVETVILSHYENEAQTLTSGAEANLLKYRELTSTMDTDDIERWNEIKKTFNRNQLLGEGGDDRIGQAIVQLGSLSDGLQDICNAVNNK